MTEACCICGKQTEGNTTDEQLPRWICPDPCAGKWREAAARNARGEYLKTRPGWRL